jgi:group II intron reverse transcriptase/maturase
MPQKPIQLELPFAVKGEAPKGGGSAESSTAATENERPGANALMEVICERDNLKRALKRVKSNGGAAGVDEMTVEELPDYLRREWPRIREQLIAGTYQPKPVRRKTIPKDGGGERQLGIPTVLDRFIEQAILQVLQPQIDPTFSPHSYGCRPGRSAHDAVRQAQEYVSQGRTWVVDIDLEQFFDRVNHDVLMGRLAKRIQDRRLLGLIRRYLEAGIMIGGVVVDRNEGTPQGGPLSPLLANVLLDEVDKELEKRGHSFVRYVDDCNVYVRSEKAGQRVMDGLRRQYSRLRLRINESKSQVARVAKRKFLGFTIYRYRQTAHLRIASKALAKMKRHVRKLTRPVVGRSLTQVCQALSTYLRGWKAYFRLAGTPKVWKPLDAWIRQRLRALRLRQWRRPKTIYRGLRALGATDEVARKTAKSAGRWWHTATHMGRIALPNRYFDELGLYRLES